MSNVIDLGKGTSSDFTIGYGSKSKGGISISGFNKELKAAVKSGEKVDFSTLDQVSSSERKRLDTKALKDYIQKHKDDKPHVQEIFSPSSPIREIYQKADSFAPKDNAIKRLIGPLLDFLSDPSLEKLKLIAGGLISEDGSEINTSENILFTNLDRNQKLAPLSAALRAIGITETAGQMKEELSTNPEGLKAQYGKEAIEAEIKESLSSLSHIFDEDGSLLQANGEPLMSALDIKEDDITALGTSDPDSLTVQAGPLKWNDFAANTFSYIAGKNPGKAVDYVNTVMAIFNKQQRDKLEAASGDRATIEDIKARNEEVIDIFAGRLAREFGGKGFAKAFESAFKRGAFASNSSVQAIAGNASNEAGNTAQITVAGNLRKTAASKKNALAEKTDVIAELVDANGKYNVLDLGNEIKKDEKSEPGMRKSTKLNYEGNSLTLVTVAEAYKKSAEIIAKENASKIGSEMLDTSVGDPTARDKYIAGGDDGKGGIREAAQKVSDTAADKDKTSADTFNAIDEKLKEIQTGQFLADPEQAGKLSKDLSKYLLDIANIRTTKDNQGKVDRLTREISNQIKNKDIDFNKIVDSLGEIDDVFTKDEILENLALSFKNSDKNQTFLNKFVNNEEIESLGNIVKAETIQDLVKSNNALKDFILRQAENKGLAASSIEDIVDGDKGLLADASPELALIFANPEQYKNDNTRAEMAMLGLMSILKSNPSLLSKVDTAKTIATKLFSKQVKGDEFKATALANKLSAYVTSTNLDIKGITDDAGADKSIDLSEAATLAGTSMNRSQYLNFVAPQVAYARESVVADRLSRMINAHTTAESRSEVHESMQAVADHLENVSNNLDGTSFAQVQTKVLEGLEGTTLSLVKNMFFPGDEFDTLGVSRDSITGNNAPQTLSDVATRLKMVIPRLYQAPEKANA